MTSFCARLGVAVIVVISHTPSEILQFQPNIGSVVCGSGLVAFVGVKGPPLETPELDRATSEKWQASTGSEKPKIRKVGAACKRHMSNSGCTMADEDDNDDDDDDNTQSN
ncbi:jg20356 [Pararge aegeria aegeria]|uniref:Jg20356 protein n=1 Tax=Pararge aegeria aegeria TaxID=348720 RepID=A0A8S4RDF9_9NEOP|nr:jg20356 [Pararge aegeria aegeria]